MKQNKMYQIENILTQMIDEHLTGLHQKIIDDFRTESFVKEIDDLTNDPVYRDFGLGSPDYALIRKVGRISISIGRRLGEIYDKIPRVIAQNAFDLVPEQVAPILGGKLELDTCIDFSLLRDTDRQHSQNVLQQFLGIKNDNGIGIEIRYNFNPNDSSRLRKDEDMARLILAKQFVPIYLVFSSISPRDEAMARLSRVGWHFLIGTHAYSFIDNLYRINFSNLFKTEKIALVVKKHINDIMRTLYTSEPFLEVGEKYSSYDA
jgi:acyl carrier protein phosphodiesterase